MNHAAAETLHNFTVSLEMSVSLTEAILEEQEEYYEQTRLL